MAGSFTVLPADIPDSLGWVRFPFTGSFQPAANTKLWAGIYRVDYASDGANYYQVALDQAMGAAENTVMYTTAWMPPAPDADMAKIILGVEETTEQARLVLSSSVSQFLSGARIEKKSGVNAPLFRNGSERGRAVVERLLKLGTATGSRLLARVEPNRYARIYEQPAASSARLRLDAAGRLRYLNRRPLEPSEWAAGEWARAGELGAAGGLYGYDGVVFVESCAWDAERGLYVISN
jgi:hypothetical protein